MVWSASKWYEGEWAENSFNGKGIFFIDDSLFFGSFKKDHKEGIGMLINKRKTAIIAKYKKNRVDPDSVCIKVKEGKTRKGFVKAGKFKDTSEEIDISELETFKEAHFTRINSLF